MSKKDQPQAPPVKDLPADSFEYLGQCPVCGESRLCSMDLTDRFLSAPGRWTMLDYWLAQARTASAKLCLLRLPYLNRPAGGYQYQNEQCCI